jgi:tRNA uridine 5-carbamoylmethylation protein Kti12
MNSWKLLFVATMLSCCGCGSYLTKAGHEAATGAFNEVTSDEAKKKLKDIATDTVKAARDEALGPTTRTELQQIITETGTSVRVQLDSAISETLRLRIRQTVREGSRYSSGGGGWRAP